MIKKKENLEISRAFIAFIGAGTDCVSRKRFNDWHATYLDVMLYLLLVNACMLA